MWVRHQIANMKKSTTLVPTHGPLAYLDPHILVQEQISQLQIAMQNSVPVQILQRQNQIVDVEHRLGLLHPPIHALPEKLIEGLGVFVGDIETTTRMRCQYESRGHPTRTSHNEFPRDG